MSGTTLKEVHVVPAHERWWRRKWEVRQVDYADPVRSVHRRRREAIEAADRLARDCEAIVLIHGWDGMIRGGNNYGEIPPPPEIIWR